MVRCCTKVHIAVCEDQSLPGMCKHNIDLGLHRQTTTFTMPCMLAVTLHLGLNMVILLNQSRIILKVEIIYDDPGPN
jgi:hypothetical protein